MADRRDDNTEETYRLIMGLGLDSDGHARVTKGDDFLLLGGSEETHERMQEDVDRFQHALDKLGTDLQSASRAEMREAAEKAGLRERREERGR
jgi:hypothetical protein